MPEITDKESLENWLKGQNKPTCVLIAHRAAMRVLPFVGQDRKKPHFDNLILMVLRANSISGFAVNAASPEVSASLSAFAATFSLSVYADSTSFISSSFSFTVSTSISTSTTAYIISLSAAALVSAASGDSFASYASASVSSFPAAAAADIWQSVNQDVKLLDQGMNIKTLSALPLWPAAAPAWFTDEWNRLKTVLTAKPEQHWQVWLDWFERRISGTDYHIAFHTDLAKLTNEDWDQDPAIVNKMITDIWAGYQAENPPSGITANNFQIIAVSNANRELIVTQIASITFLLDSEVDKIRGKNVANDIEVIEKQRQLDFFATLRGQLQNLPNAIPDADSDEEKAEEIKHLLVLFYDHLKKWPRDNVVELTDSAWRAALIGVAAGIGASFGMPMIGASIGGAMFGGKKIAEIIGKAIKSDTS